MIYFSTICVLTGSYDDGISHNINIYYGINNWKASSVGNASEKHQTTKISDPSIQVSCPTLVSWLWEGYKQNVGKME